MPDGDERWMTYRELAQARGTSYRAAAVLVRRHKGWQRTKGNDGTMRVLVPARYSERTAHIQDTNSLTLAEEILTEVRQAYAEALSQAQAAHKAALEQARAEAQEARGRLESLEAIRAAERGRGRWSRLRAAWKSPD